MARFGWSKAQKSDPVMPSDAEFLARDICRKAGYNPDQLVIPVDSVKDFDYLYMGFVPVSIPNLQPLFMKFIHDAERKIK